jgi:ABC-type dipeptide/oligopeptide/nickel transport system permease component
MQRYIAQRILWGVPVLLMVSIITFTAMRLVPGGPFTSGGGGRPVPPDIRANMERKYGLDKPAWQQYLSYMYRLIFHFDFGPSFRKPGRTVNQMIFGINFWKAPLRAPILVSAQVGLVSLLLAVGLGVPLGLISALKQNSWIDYIVMFFSMLGVSIPNFVLGIILIFVFGLWLGWLPIFGWGDTILQMVLPAVTLGTHGLAFIARLSRASMLEIIHQDYIRTARAKGLRERVVIIRHALKNSLIPVTTILGPMTAAWLTGSFMVEWVFSIGGIGKFFVTAVTDRDYTLIMGTILIYGAALVFFNLVVDIAYAFIDPRIRFE